MKCAAASNDSRHRIGIDIQSAAEVAESLDHFGQRYLDRLFTPLEISQSNRAGTIAPALAARFAAKEAVAKVLDTDSQGIDFRTLEIASHDGRWSAYLEGDSASRAEELGLTGLHLSVTNTEQAAMAVAIATFVEPAYWLRSGEVRTQSA